MEGWGTQVREEAVGNENSSQVQYSEVLYHPFLLSVLRGCVGCLRPHRTAVLQKCTAVNQIPALRVLLTEEAQKLLLK